MPRLRCFDVLAQQTRATRTGVCPVEQDLIDPSPARSTAVSGTP